MRQLVPNPRPGKEVNGRDGSREPAAAMRARTVIAAALGPLVAGYTAVAALLALITAAASVTTFSVSGVLRAAAPGWLAAYQVPITIMGRPLGVLPLAATAGVCALVARSASHAAQRLGYREPGQAVGLVAPMAGAHALFGVVIALLSTGTGVTVEPLAAFLVPGLVGALSATVGVAGSCGLVAAAVRGLDPLAIRGLRAGALGMAGLLAAGTLVFTASLVLSTSAVGRMFGASAPGLGSGAGMLLLSLGYLPNGIVGALSFAVGPGFSIGSVSIGPLSFTGGVVPGIPLLAGIPEQAAPWWPLLMLLPAGAGALVGWSLRDSGDLRSRLRTVGIAGAVIGFGCVALGAVAGGRLGTGPFDPVTVPAGLMSVAAFGWIVIPGGLVAWRAGPRARPPEDADTEGTEETPAPAEGDEPEPGVLSADDTEDLAEDTTDEDVPEDVIDDGAQNDGAQNDGAQNDGAQNDGAQNTADHAGDTREGTGDAGAAAHLSKG